MRKDVALQNYFEDFMREQFPGMDIGEEDYYLTYPETSVPKDTVMPYLTYQYVDADFNEGEVAITVYMWFRSTNESLPNESARALKKYISKHPMIPCEDGAIWVKAGNPFSQAITEESDLFLKGRYINVTLEHLTI